MFEDAGYFKQNKQILSIPWVKKKDLCRTASNAVLCKEEKPISFYMDYLSGLKNIGLVLDTFAGTCSASVAAAYHGLDFIALDTTFTAVNCGKERLEKIGITVELKEHLGFFTLPRVKIDGTFITFVKFILRIHCD